MSRYEDLTEKQKELYNTLKDAIENKKNITPILEEIKKEGVLKEVLTTANITKKLKDGTEYNLTPIVYAMHFNNFEEKIKAILDVAQKNSVLEELLNSTKENDRAHLKKILETFKNQEQDEGQKTKINDWLAILADSISGCKGNEKPLVPESRVPKTEENIVKTTNKSIIIGSICGVIAALTVGGGCFAAGIALPILALIGIAVAAAVFTGLIAGGITYEVCKPCNELNGGIRSE
ncbi:MAG: hypothetical protein ACR5LA_00005 [Wolbachia sp.]